MLKETSKPGCLPYYQFPHDGVMHVLSLLLYHRYTMSIPAFALFKSLKDMLLYLHIHFVFMIPQTTIFEDCRSAVYNSQNMEKTCGY